MINPNLDISALAESFKHDKRLQIPNFMQDTTAQRLYQAGINDVPYDLQYVIDDEYQSMPLAEVRKLSPQQSLEINNKITADASNGIGYLYDSYLHSRALNLSINDTNSELKFIHQIFDYLSSDEVLDQVKRITGNKDINAAKPQYTRYSPGHFLTRHLDVIPGRNRRYAFVLGLTKDWHPDWGGLLQFYENNGIPRDAWMPQFNVLSIFDVSHIHAVTYVTPYATQPRLSITGWFVARE